MIRGLRALGLTVAEIRGLAESSEPVGPRLARLLAAARERASDRIPELQDLLTRIEEFEAQHRDERSGTVRFETGDPRGAR